MIKEETKDTNILLFLMEDNLVEIDDEEEERRALGFLSKHNCEKWLGCRKPSAYPLFLHKEGSLGNGFNFRYWMYTEEGVQERDENMQIRRASTSYLGKE